MGVERHNFRDSTNVERFSAGEFVILADSPKTNLWIPVVLTKDGIEYHTTIDTVTGELTGKLIATTDSDRLDPEQITVTKEEIKQVLQTALSIQPLDRQRSGSEPERIEPAAVEKSTEPTSTEPFQTPQRIAEARALEYQRHDELID